MRSDDQTDERPRPRRPYERPEVCSESAFERMALACANPTPNLSDPFNCDANPPRS